eukprot:438219-Pyramimonas_sp.AAC.1
MLSRPRLSGGQIAGDTPAAPAPTPRAFGHIRLAPPQRYARDEAGSGTFEAGCAMTFRDFSFRSSVALLDGVAIICCKTLSERCRSLALQKAAVREHRFND